MIRICGVAKRYSRVAPQIRSGMDVDVILRNMSYQISQSFFLLHGTSVRRVGPLREAG